MPMVLGGKTPSLSLVGFENIRSYSVMSLLLLSPPIYCLFPVSPAQVRMEYCMNESH